MPDREQRVREIAYRLWEQEDRPSDQDKQHWVTAERIFDAQERMGATPDAAMARDQAKANRAPTRRAGKRTTAKPHAGATIAH